MVRAGNEVSERIHLVHHPAGIMPRIKQFTVIGVLGALHPDYLDTSFARSLEANGVIASEPSSARTSPPWMTRFVSPRLMVPPGVPGVTAASIGANKSKRSVFRTRGAY